jgi:uncharacterized protein YprB with RNaseH-like and TPR domain
LILPPNLCYPQSSPQTRGKTNRSKKKLASSIYELENELAELVHERDKLLFHICPNIQTKYMLKIGKIEYAIFDWKAGVHTQEPACAG